jgi:hypothetical protein
VMDRNILKLKQSLASVSVTETEVFSVLFHMFHMIQYIYTYSGVASGFNSSL